MLWNRDSTFVQDFFGLVEGSKDASDLSAGILWNIWLQDKVRFHYLGGNRLGQPIPFVVKDS